MPPGSARPWRRDRGRALEPLKTLLSSSIKWEQRQLLRKVKCGRRGTCLGWCPTCRGSPHTAATVVATVTMPRETADEPCGPPSPPWGAVLVWFLLLSSHLLTPLPQVEVEGGSLNFPALLNTINSCREWQNLTRARALVFGRKTERWPQGIKYCVPRSPRPGAAASEQATVPSVRSLKWAQTAFSSWVLGDWCWLGRDDVLTAGVC